MAIQRAKRKVIYDEVQITKNGQEYTLPVGWCLSDAGSYSFRNKLQDKAYSHGSNVVGDGKIDGRTIVLGFDSKEATEEEHDEMLNLAYTYFSLENYNLRCGREDRVYHVAGLSKIKHKYLKGFKGRGSEISVSLLLADPFRYEAKESKVVYVFSGEAKEAVMKVVNLGSVDTPLTFRFIPKSPMSSIQVFHKETKENFTMTDALLISPSITIVNGKEGTVWRDLANSINTYSGQFLHAKPGMNTFLYSGGAGTVEITYTNRWFV